MGEDGRRLFTRWATSWFAVSTGLAVLAYPGGTIQDHTARGYSIVANVLSDLGRTVALNGEPNRLGAALFVSGFSALMLALLAGLPAFVRAYSVSGRQRRWARAAAAAACLSYLAFLGVALSPVNLFPTFHNLSALLGWFGILVAALLFALATARNARVSGRVAAGWLGLAVLVAANIWIDCLGPFAPDSETGLFVLATEQKTVGFVGLLILLFQTRAADRALHGTGQSGAMQAGP